MIITLVIDTEAMGDERLMNVGHQLLSEIGRIPEVEKVTILDVERES